MQSLAQFRQKFHFYTPRRRQKTTGILTFSGGIQMKHCFEMGKKQFSEIDTRVLNKAEAHSEPTRRSTMELFYKNCYRLKTVHHFCKKVSL